MLVQLVDPPLFHRLRDARTVLIAGAGGGFDVYCGLPLYFALQGMGKQVHLANLTFSDLRQVDGERLHPSLVEVTADTEGPSTYFPEGLLCRWFRTQGEDVTILCFQKTGVVPLTEAYGIAAARTGADALLLVDGGTDILMRGDEVGLGTPDEDIASLAAADALPLPTKLVACLGFGVDAYHGVCHAQFLEGVAELSRAGGYLGALSLLPNMREAQRYLAAVQWAHELSPDWPSIVNTSIAAALEGEYGDVHRTHRTRHSRLWINPLMSQYFAFDLDAVARRVLYLDDIRFTHTSFEITAAIEAARRRLTIRDWEPIPV